MDGLKLSRPNQETLAVLKGCDSSDRGWDSVEKEGWRHRILGEEPAAELGRGAAFHAKGHPELRAEIADHCGAW